MLELYVSGQTLRIYTPVIAADTLHYLTGQVYFLGREWEGYTRWVHFRQGEGAGATFYDVVLDPDDRITGDKALNLTIGEWTVYLTGSKGESRLTTAPVIITVKASGLIDAPLHPMPMSVAEQIDAKAQTALAYAAAVREAAETGAFDGKDGSSFVIAGYYDTRAELAAAVNNPIPGEAYGVGTAAPYDIYIWDGVNRDWRNNGPLQGARGEEGAAGATFTPALDASGNLSWSNDGGLANPPARNIRGPAGQDGERGPAGPSAYDAAAAAGYTGTENTFHTALASMPYHNARHLPSGADPIVVQTGNLAGGCVTEPKIAAGAVSRTFTGTLTAAGWSGSAAPYSQQLSAAVTAEDAPIVDVQMSGTYETDKARGEQFAAIYRAVAAAGKITFYAGEKPEVDLPVKILCIRK